MTLRNLILNVGNGDDTQAYRGNMLINRHTPGSDDAGVFIFDSPKAVVVTNPPRVIPLEVGVAYHFQPKIPRGDDFYAYMTSGAEDLAYADLVPIDPSTLLPGPTPGPAWEVALDDVADQVAGKQDHSALAADTAALVTSASALKAALDGKYASLAVGLLCAPSGTAAANRTKVQADANTAVSFGFPLIVQGAFSIAGTVTVPAGAVIDLSRATITQTSNLSTSFLAAAGNTFTGGKIIGKGTDWVNTSGVYAASGIFVGTSANNVTIKDLTITNMAGAGVYCASAVDNLRVINPDFSGVGSGVIPAGTGQYSGGVVLNSVGFTDIFILGGRIRDFAQGIVGGTVAGIHIGGDLKISTVGQHGIYLQAVGPGSIAHVTMDGIALEGLKLQITDTMATDTDILTIGDLALKNIGSHGVHLANIDGTSPTQQSHRVVIHDVVVTHTTLGNGDDILIEYASDVTIHDCHGTNGSRGLAVANSTRINEHDNRFNTTNNSGIHLTDVTDSSFTRARIIDPARGGTAGNKYGIYVTGTTSADLRFDGVRISDSTGAAQYGIYVFQGDLASMSFINCHASGVSDYGFRATTNGVVAAWINNRLRGTLGRYFAKPFNADNYPAAVNTLLGWAFDPTAAIVAQAATAAGVIAASKVTLPAGGSITKIVGHLTTAGTLLTSGQCFLGVYDSTGALIGTTVDLSTDWLTAGAKSYALVTPTADLKPGESVFIAILWNGTGTAPAFRGINGSGQGNIGITATTDMRFTTSGTAQTALPSTLATRAAAAVAAWFGVA